MCDAGRLETSLVIWTEMCGFDKPPLTPGYEVISGHEAERILGRSLAMLLKAPARRTYSFVAPNERERTAWASAFGRLGRGESVEGFGAGHVTLTIEKATARYIEWREFCS